MQFRYGLITAWMLATTASILVAFAAVGSVRTAIADPPSALLLPVSPSSALELPPLSELQQSTVPDPEVVDGAPLTSDEAVPDPGEPPPADRSEPVAAPTTQASVATTAPSQDAVSTTVAPSTTTTQVPTTQPPTDSIETYETEGGWVTVRSSPQGVFLESASPKPGWSVDTEGRGPEHFTVVFKGDDEEIHVVVSLDDGEVEIKVED
jgi:hypothetical protein